MARRYSFFLFTLICLLVGGVLYHGVNALRNNTRHSLQKTALAETARDLHLHYAKTMDGLHALAANPDIQAVLAGEPSPEARRAADGTLQTVLAATRGDLAFVLDVEGLVVLCANVVETSILGNRYPYRRYFQIAVAGGEDLYPVVGGNEYIRGLCYSAPVRDPASGAIIGVVAMKRGVEEWQAVLRAVGMPACVISPEGVVFEATEPDWVLRVRGDTAEDTRQAVLAVRQFADSPLERLDWLVDGETLRVGGDLLHVMSRPIFPEGWSVYAFYPASRLVALPAEVYWNLVSIAAALLTLSLVSIGLLRTIERRRELEGELRTLNGSLAFMVDARMAELRESNAHLKKLSAAVSQSPSIVVITDADGNIEYVNPVFTRVTGYGLEDVRGRNPRFLKSGETSPEEYARLWQTITSGGTWRGEFHNRKKNGDLYWEQAVIAPIRNDDGETENFLAVKEDITERRATEEQARSLARFPSEDPNPVMRADADGRLLYANGPAAPLVAVMLLPGEACLSPEWVDFVRMVIAAGAPVRKEVRVGELVFACTCSPVTEDRYVNLYALDVTEHTETARALRKSNDALVELNRRLMVNQKQLIQSEKLASLGQLAAGVAHEINNPVGFVMSNLGTMAEYVGVFGTVVRLGREIQEAASLDDAPRLAAAVERLGDTYRRENVDFLVSDSDLLVRESCDGMARVRDIVQNLKSFGRSDDATLQDCDLNAILDGCLKMVWNELKYRCEVVREFGSLPPFRGVEGQLRQVFVNLLINAAQAIETKGVVRVSTSCDATHLRVAVSDTGCGIAPEQIPLLFDPFYTTKPVGQGTGLGLSIAHGIIMRHGGEIRVESAPGEGATFIVLLPRAGVPENGTATGNAAPEP